MTASVYICLYILHIDRAGPCVYFRYSRFDDPDFVRICPIVATRLKVEIKKDVFNRYKTACVYLCLWVQNLNSFLLTSSQMKATAS